MSDKLSQMNSITGARALADTAVELNRVHFTQTVPKNFKSSSELEDSVSEINKSVGVKNSNYAVAKMNAEAAIGPLSMEQQNYSLNRLRDIAVEAASEKYGSSDQIFMLKEYQQLKAEIERISRETNDRAKVTQAIQQYQTVQSMPLGKENEDSLLKMVG